MGESTDKVRSNLRFYLAGMAVGAAFAIPIFFIPVTVFLRIFIVAFAAGGIASVFVSMSKLVATSRLAVATGLFLAVAAAGVAMQVVSRGDEALTIGGAMIGFALVIVSEAAGVFVYRLISGLRR